MALKNRSQPPNTKGQVIFYTDKEKEALSTLAMGQLLKVQGFRLDGRHTFGELVCALILT
jgi:hypothetical protein